MIESTNPVLFYHPDAYGVLRDDLKGRHSAGESFLTAFLEQAEGPEVHALCRADTHFDDFAKAVKESGRPLTPRRVLRQDAPARRAPLHLPIPEIGDEARCAASWAPISTRFVGHRRLDRRGDQACADTRCRPRRTRVQAADGAPSLFQQNDRRRRRRPLSECAPSRRSNDVPPVTPSISSYVQFMRTLCGACESLRMPLRRAGLIF
jgi:hypothetical protein